MIKPIRGNVLFKPLPSDNVSEGGIIVPDSFKKPSNRGVIVAVGDGVAGKPMRLRVGQVGYRIKDYGQEIMEGGELYYLLNQEHILAVD